MPNLKRATQAQCAAKVAHTTDVVLSGQDWLTPGLLEAGDKLTVPQVCSSKG